MINIFQLSGALGLVCITIGVLLKKRVREDIFYVIGGLLLEVYSVYIRDPVFITLQIIFIGAAVYDFIKIQFLGKKK